jgi:hypothetical protein
MRGKLVSGEEKWGFDIPRIVLGRGPTSDIKVSDSGASRQHAELWVNYNQQYMVLDCGSRNGTYLNDKLICGPTLLKQGDVIRIGEQRFEFNGNKSRQGQAPTSMIKTGVVVPPPPKFPIIMLAIRLFENKEVLAAEPIVHSCGLGQWFSKQIEIVSKHQGYINHLGKRLIFAYWQAEGGELANVLEKAVACAGESLHATQSMDEELKMALSGVSEHALMTSVAAIHLGKVEGIEAGSEGSEYYMMGGTEVETCSDLTLKTEPSLKHFVCVENVSRLMPGLPKKPLTLSTIGPKQQSVMLYQVEI